MSEPTVPRPRLPSSTMNCCRKPSCSPTTSTPTPQRVWTQRFGSGNGIDDFRCYFAYDYSAWNWIPNLPPAPHSTADSLGLYLTVNKDEGSALGGAGINVYPTGRSFGGNYAVRFDMYLMVGSSASTTEYALFGINHSGLSQDQLVPEQRGRRAGRGFRWPLVWRGERRRGAGRLRDLQRPDDDREQPHRPDRRGERLESDRRIQVAALHLRGRAGESRRLDHPFVVGCGNQPDRPLDHLEDQQHG